MATTLDAYAPYDAGPGADSMEATWRAMMRRVLADGVFASVLNEFEVFADSTGLQIKVKSGECWIAGHWGQSTAEKILPVSANALGITRGDRVVLRNHFGNNRIELDVLTGTTGTPPAVTQDTSLWEVSLATLSVPNGDLSIDAGQVTDARIWTQTAYRPRSLDALCSAPLTVSTSQQDVAGCSISVTTPIAQTVEVTGIFDVNATGATDPFRGLCLVNTTPETEEAVRQLTGRSPTAQTWLVPLTAGAHVLSLAARKNTTTDTLTVAATHTKIIVRGAGIYPTP